MFYDIKKALRAGAHCGGEVDVAQGDPPQAGKPAKQVSFLITKRGMKNGKKQHIHTG